MDNSLVEFYDSLGSADPIELSRSILMANYADPSVCFVRGEGAWLYDTSGKAYLDFLSGIAVTSLGHCNPRVMEAIASQAGRLLHVSNLFANEVGPKVAALVDRLIRDGNLDKGQGRVFFANSGAEANEAAIKLVRKYGGADGRYHIVATDGSFHGRTMGALSATGQPGKQKPFEPLVPGFTHVPWNDIDLLEKAVGDQTVAVMIETIQGEGGVNDPAEGYLAEVRRLCDDRGVLLVVDEVQTGFGRTGRWFAFQEHGILPDVVTVAKALGSGMPIGACWARAEVAAAFSSGDHGTTFGGQPLAASAALATLREMIEIDAPQRAQTIGAQIERTLSGVKGIEDISGRGILIGLQLSGPVAKKVAAKVFSEGLIVNPIGDRVIRLAPPFVVSPDEVAHACDLIAQALGELK